MEQDIVPISTCTDISANITENCTLIDDGPRLCPLCNSIVKLFFINFNQKILMCENTRCDFPFGYEDVKFFKEDNGAETDVELISLQTRPSASQCAASLAYTTEWFDIHRLNRVCDSEDGQSTISMTYNKSKRREIERRVKAREKEKLLQKNVDKIKELNQILFEEDEVDTTNYINNEEWIKNLYKLQKSSGKRLLNEQELRKVKKKKPAIGLGELKTDINTEQNCLSSIKIELLNQKNV